MRLLHVTYKNGDKISFGVPDGWIVPAAEKLKENEWLVIPWPANIALRLLDVAWLSAADENRIPADGAA